MHEAGLLSGRETVPVVTKNKPGDERQPKGIVYGASHDGAAFEHPCALPRFHRGQERLIKAAHNASRCLMGSGLDVGPGNLKKRDG